LNRLKNSVRLSLPSWKCRRDISQENFSLFIKSYIYFVEENDGINCYFGYFLTSVSTIFFRKLLPLWQEAERMKKVWTTFSRHSAELFNDCTSFLYCLKLNLIKYGREILFDLGRYQWWFFNNWRQGHLKGSFLSLFKATRKCWEM
jgi:hypothetical protein